MNVIVNDDQGMSGSVTAVVVSPPSFAGGPGGQFQLEANGELHYLPEDSYSGQTDSFTYKLVYSAWETYPAGETDPATVTLSWKNTKPEAVADGPYTALSSSTLTVSKEEGVLVNDVDPDKQSFPDGGFSITAELKDNADHGTVNLAGDGSFTYTPDDPTWTGTDQFTYRAFDGTLYSDVVTVSIDVIKPTVSLVSQPDPILREHAFVENNGTLRAYRTGPTDESLTVNFTVAGEATEGTDYANVGGSVTIPAGQSVVDISLTVINDQKVEGSESIVLALEAGNYIKSTNNSSATATIQDNDYWQWMPFAGDELTEAEGMKVKDLPGWDWPGQNPASMSLFGSVSASDNEVSAELSGTFYDDTYTGDVLRMVSDNFNIAFDFEPATGNIYRTELISALNVQQDHELNGAIGFSYVINNGGDLLHTVTVDVGLHVVVAGTMAATVGGNVGAGADGGLSGELSVSISNVSSIGGRIDALAGITLKLGVFENNN